MLTDKQKARLMSVNLEWKQALLVDGPGWYTSDTGMFWTLADSPPDFPLPDGWAWAPCCRLAWLLATGTYWHTQTDAEGLAWTWPPFADPQEHGHADPIDAFLDYAETHPAPERKR
jgi:hypothetical protein